MKTSPMAVIACTMQSFVRRVWSLGSDGSLSRHTTQPSCTPCTTFVKRGHQREQSSGTCFYSVYQLNNRHSHHKTPILTCILGLKILERNRKQYILNQWCLSRWSPVSRILWIIYHIKFIFTFIIINYTYETVTTLLF